MLDVCYYNTQIKEELDGAADYIKRATNCKAEHPEWADRYAKMSDMELGHAKTLVEIFDEDFKMGVNPEDSNLAAGVYTTIHDMYSEFAAKVKYMQEMYEAM